MVVQLALFALLLAAYGLVAARLDRLSISSAMAFVVCGVVVAELILGPLTLEINGEPMKILAEAALTLVLFADASEIRTRTVRHDAALVGRLLLIGLPLTIAAGTIGAALLFPGISVGVALLIGSTLAPTDAALGQAVVTNTAVPARIRTVLNIESGLNDGIATPFVFLALGLAVSEATSRGNWFLDAVHDFSIGAVVGLFVGFAGGWLLAVAVKRGWASGASSQLATLALAASCYLVAVAVGGNGFIAAFVGGLAFGAGSSQHVERAVRFTQTQGALLAIGVWTAFGLLLAGEVREHLFDLNAAVYALLSLTVIRMLPVALALLGSRLQLASVAFVGWFGPRGLASIVFLVIGLEGLHSAGIDTTPLSVAVAWTVLLSVLLHGLSAGPLATRYGRLTRSFNADAPELAESTEPQPARLAWARDPHVLRDEGQSQETR